MPYEVPTNDLRTVRYGSAGYIQRKWLVQNGLLFAVSNSTKPGPDDIDVSPCGDEGRYWVPGRAEWRDLPSVEGAC